MHLTDIANNTPDKVAYTMLESGSSVTFSQLEALSNQSAHAFRALGLKRGDHIALVLHNHLQFLVLCMAARRSGLYYTAVSHRLQVEEIDYIIGDSGAKIVITAPEYAPTLQKSMDAHPQTRYFSLDQAASGCASWDEFSAQQPTTPIVDESQGTDMLYSSGTTGKPKGIKSELPEPGVPNALGARLNLLYGMDENTLYLSPAPLYHAAPLRFSMGVLDLGGSLVVAERFDPERVLQAIDAHGITHAQWVPTMFVRMLKLPEAQRLKHDVSSLKYAIHAAAPCPVDIKRAMIDWWGPILCEYYAGTEGNGMCMCNSEEWLQNPGTVGKPITAVLHILDDDFNELAQGEEGGVYFSGGGDFAYHNDPKKTAAATSPQGFTTLGDIGYINERGFLFLTDRKAHTIISGGVNIYPQETEDTLITHPAVLDAAVIGVPDEEFGEAVKAVVQRVEGSGDDPELAEALIQWCRERISALKCPKSVDFVDELPRHPTGKLYKRLLKDSYWKDAKRRI